MRNNAIRKNFNFYPVISKAFEFRGKTDHNVIIV